MTCASCVSHVEKALVGVAGRQIRAASIWRRNGPAYRSPGAQTASATRRGCEGGGLRSGRRDDRDRRRRHDLRVLRRPCGEGAARRARRHRRERQSRDGARAGARACRPRHRKTSLRRAISEAGYEPRVIDTRQRRERSRASAREELRCTSLAYPSHPRRGADGPRFHPRNGRAFHSRVSRLGDDAHRT